MKPEEKEQWLGVNFRDGRKDQPTGFRLFRLSDIAFLEKDADGGWIHLKKSAENDHGRKTYLVPDDEFDHLLKTGFGIERKVPEATGKTMGDPE